MSDQRLPYESSDRPSPIWSFLNSAFGLWLLGSVALALITWGFGATSTYYAAKRTRETASARLTAELVVRFEAAFYENAIRDPSAGQVRLSPDKLATLAQIALANANGNRSVGFPEYLHVPATALLAELREMTTKRPEVDEILRSWLHYEVRFREQADPQAGHEALNPTSEELRMELDWMREHLRQVGHD